MMMMMMMSRFVAPYPTIATLFAGYLVLVQLLRYRRRQLNQQLFQLSTTENGQHDPEIARRIQLRIIEYEFPLVCRLSLEFALFRTYAIPSISKLLLSTKQFELTCGKRYDDTDLLIAEVTQNPFDSERSRTAVQRINTIHTMYATSITNDDMLYVLSVFIVEPYRWIGRFEWRGLTKEEYQAIYVAWCKIGQDMGIRDIPATLEEYENWNEAYEAKHMMYSPSNRVIADATVNLFLSLAPKFLHGFGHEVAYCLMDERLRRAMGFPIVVNQPLRTCLFALLKFRAWWIRYACLPRLWSCRRTPWAPTAQGKLCPRFHVYERTYPHGYETSKLGTAPAGKLMTTCPRWK